MTIDKVTSLADLEFKAKTNKYYQQLAILGAKRCCNTPTKYRQVDTFEKAMAWLHEQSVQHCRDSCKAYVTEINHCCNKIVEEVVPPPVVEAATPPSADGAPLSPVAASVETLRAIVADLKKKDYESQESSPWNQLWETLQNPYAAESRPFNEALERERQQFAERQRRLDNEDRQLYRNRPSYNSYNQYMNYYYTNSSYITDTSDPE